MMIAHTKTLLIIDDEEDLRDTIEYKFKASGFKVVTAVDGLDGLEKLKTVKPDLIILDMNMPRMNGLQFYQKITGKDEKPMYPVLVLTARANMEQLFKDLDVDGFMFKPFELDELLKETETIIKKHSGLVRRERGSDELRAKKVCIVENDQKVCKDLAIAFLECGYIVNSAQSGASAITRNTMDVPDVVVISLWLNDIAGDVVIGKLKRMNKTKDVKYILYTSRCGEDTEITREISQKTGVDRFVVFRNENEILDAADSLFQ
jgi:DNA-binding response OmpR family regulator